jgi:hypothetical protein
LATEGFEGKSALDFVQSLWISHAERGGSRRKDGFRFTVNKAASLSRNHEKIQTRLRPLLFFAVAFHATQIPNALTVWR